MERIHAHISPECKNFAMSNLFQNQPTNQHTSLQKVWV
jgi:hypothetical protein